MSDGSRAPEIDAGGVIAGLRELAAGTSSGSGGAERVCWTPGWRRARELLRSQLGELAIESETDEAGNLWARVPGSDRDAPALALGSHLDSVPGGGWLDGALGVMAALGALRAWREAGEALPRDLILIDFADEEGARFGRSLFGSSALAGTLVPEELMGLRDRDGEPIADALAEDGVELARAPLAHRRLRALGAYLELHIEQGPVLDGEELPCAAVSGCAGVERHTLTFRGQAAHAGTTPMDARRDAGLAAAETVLAVARIARDHGGVGTAGRLVLQPGIATAVAGEAELAVDLRHPESGALEDMLSKVLAAAAGAADRRRCVLDGEPIWRIEPVAFDAGLVESARRACLAVGGREQPLVSGALHDAAEVARRVPAAMVFCASLGGISHAREEDSDEADLVTAIGAFSRLVAATLAG